MINDLKDEIYTACNYCSCIICAKNFYYLKNYFTVILDPLISPPNLKAQTKTIDDHHELCIVSVSHTLPVLAYCRHTQPLSSTHKHEFMPIKTITNQSPCRNKKNMIIKLSEWTNHNNTIIKPLFNGGIPALSITKLLYLFPSIVDVEHNWTRAEPPLKTPTD